MGSRKWLASAVIVGVGLAAVGAQQPASAGSPQSPVRSGVDLVQLDVSVIDRNNQPVRGLTAADFTILDEGTAQPLATFAPVDAVVPGPARIEGSSRRVVIVMDDAYTGVDRGQAKSAMEIGRTIVSELEPTDSAAVTFTYMPGQLRFTSDRRRLVEAVESYTLKNWSPSTNAWRSDGRTTGGAPESVPQGPPIACRGAGGCVVETMKNVGAYLASIGPERKLVMLISSNPAVAIRDDPARPGPLKEMLQALQRANVAVYAFDPQGLTRRDTDEARQSRDDLLSISEATGGRGITGTNAPESLVRDVFRQNSSYYLLGFRPSHTTRDGRFHRISVRVKQPDVTVRTRSGYYASK